MINLKAKLMKIIYDKISSLLYEYLNLRQAETGTLTSFH
jgi:hypothetical protein